jgi:hypothetical protein
MNKVLFAACCNKPSLAIERSDCIKVQITCREECPRRLFFQSPPLAISKNQNPFNPWYSTLLCEDSSGLLYDCHCGSYAELVCNITPQCLYAHQWVSNSEYSPLDLKGANYRLNTYNMLVLLRLMGQTELKERVAVQLALGEI